MIKPHCFGKDWFQSMSKKYRYNDLGIIEKVIRAFALLDFWPAQAALISSRVAHASV